MLLLPGILTAQTDTIPRSIINNFYENISALSDLYCWNDSSYLEGEFANEAAIVFSDAANNIKLFSNLDLEAEKYFNYLQGLSVHDKQNLIRYFSFYELFIENELKACGLPADLKYLAPTLSAMNPLAIGKNTKAGIWQLEHFQGILNGLEINRLVDERFHPQLSSSAAVQQLKQNATIFGSAELAVIAFMVGNTKLQNAMLRCAPNKNLPEVLKLLPQSVTNTIALYKAVSVFLQKNTFRPAQNIETPGIVAVKQQVHFSQIAQVINVSEDQLKFLNPHYVYSIVPGEQESRQLVVPKGKRDDFVLWLDSIYNCYDSTLFQVVAQNIEYPPAPNRQYLGEKVKDLEIEGKTKIKYTIKSGDVLGFIAEEYDVRVADLKYWNNIYNERRIQVGQKLDIFVDNDKADYYAGLQQNNKKASAKPIDMVGQLTKNSPLPYYTAPKSAKKVEHVVKSGESPYVIAKKYEGVTPEEILEWNGIADARKIQIGQKLIIYLE